MCACLCPPPPILPFEGLYVGTKGWMHSSGNLCSWLCDRANIQSSGQQHSTEPSHTSPTPLYFPQFFRVGQEFYKTNTKVYCNLLITHRDGNSFSIPKLTGSSFFVIRAKFTTLSALLRELCQNRASSHGHEHVKANTTGEEKRMTNVYTALYLISPASRLPLLFAFSDENHMSNKGWSLISPTPETHWPQASSSFISSSSPSLTLCAHQP